MKQRIIKLTLFLLVGAIINVAVACRAKMKPAWPSPPRNSFNQPSNDVDSDSVSVSIAFIRTTQGGLYIDLLLQNLADEHSAPVLGAKLSRAPDPTRLIELQDSQGHHITLVPAQWPIDQNVGFFRAGFIDMAPLPHRKVGQGVVLQTSMFRTEAAIEPGIYRARLSENWLHDDGLSDFRDRRFVPNDFEWHEVEVLREIVDVPPGSAARSM